MKNAMKYTTLAATVLLTGLALGSHSVYAEDETSGDGASVQSVGTISYITDDSSVDPVDPLDPTKPIQPTDPDVPAPTAGPLSIDYVSSLRFGEQKTTGTDMTYHAQLDHIIDSEGNEIDRPNFVQVTDKRGSNAGWHLSVTQDEQFKCDSDVLQGAELTLNNGTLSTPNEGTAPFVNQGITLTPGEASDVMDAKEDQGTGTWLDRFGNDEEEGKDSVSLFVPGKTKKVQGEYKTTLTWALTDAPA